MIAAMPESLAFSEWLRPEEMWRSSCAIAAAGCEDHAEWLHGMAVTLLDIAALPLAPLEA